MDLVVSLYDVSFVGDSYGQAFFRVELHQPFIFPLLEVVQIILHLSCVSGRVYGPVQDAIVSK